MKVGKTLLVHTQKDGGIITHSRGAFFWLIIMLLTIMAQYFLFDQHNISYLVIKQRQLEHYDWSTTNYAVDYP
jgi:hypothetical protein